MWQRVTGDAADQPEARPAAQDPAGPAARQAATNLLDLARRSLLDLFLDASAGLVLLDRQARIVWCNDTYRLRLQQRGFDGEAAIIGRRATDVLPHTRMHRALVSGEPTLVDLMSYDDGNFVVSRLPLRDEAGVVVGLLGIVLHDRADETLQPLIRKFAGLQARLDATRRARTGGRTSRHTFDDYLGDSAAAASVRALARRAARSASPVLLQGETGTGKELLAHAIHAASARAAHRFVAVNMAAIPETLLEAEFFGVAPGAYTGADRRGRAGRFQLADRGTLFLDEIADMPVTMQTKLLRVLQEGEVEPLGADEVVAVDVRVVAATSRDLRQRVDEGRFREDLYYRLAVLPIRVPPLRERRDDIPLLIDALCAQIARQGGIEPLQVTADAVALLQRQPWRGNVRELRNRLEQAALHGDTGVVSARLVAELLRASGDLAADPGVPGEPALGHLAPGDLPTGGRDPLDEPAASLLGRPLAETVDALERRVIDAALRRTAGNRAAAARLIGVSRAAFYEKLRRLGVDTRRPPSA